MRQFLNTTFAAAVLTATVAVAAPAAATELTIRIDLSNLDIANPADVEAIHNRIALTVTRACRANGRPMLDSGAVSACKADGTAKALQQLNRMRDSFASAD